MPSAVEAAPAKINLALHIRGRRADGYHAIETLAVFAKVADTVTRVAGTNSGGLAVDGPFADAIDTGTGNLVSRAAAALTIGTGDQQPALKLTKNIPVAAGLGGGSADAAATLRLLNRSRAPAFSNAELEEIAIGLGADVPMCVGSVPVVAKGVGDRLRAAMGVPPLDLVLLFPGVGVGTASVFAARDNRDDGPLPARGTMPGIVDFVAWLETTSNGLEATACAIVPEIEPALAALAGSRGCLMARMTGSGSCCFGIFPTRADAEAAAVTIHANHPAWWVRSTTSGPSA